MNKAKASIFIDKYHPQKDSRCSITVRITYERKKKYYPTNMSLLPADFEKIMAAKRRNETENQIHQKILSFQKKAFDTLERLPVFTYSKFEELFFENKNASDTISFAFDNYINELREEKRIGTAISYECAKRSIESFRKEMRFADITQAFLKQYENWMLANDKSRTTVGIYLRSLRTIFNRANIDKSLYPFGIGQKKYSIPTGKNIKKALTLNEISRIFHYDAKPNSNEEMAKDYWIFIYLCNGLNVKDLCLLKQKNIQGNVLFYERAKTRRSKNNGQQIKVSLKPEAKAVISKWGLPSINSESYIFPHLKKGMSPEIEIKVIQQLTKTINKYIKRIANELSLDKDVTTYFARHSFATVLRNSGASTEFISEALGHSSMKTTQSYLASFEEETIHKTTDVLTQFGKEKQA